MYCTNCGAENSNRANFCFSCGTALRQGRAADSSKAAEAVTTRAEAHKASAPDGHSFEQTTSSNTASVPQNAVFSNKEPRGVSGWLFFLDFGLLFINPVAAAYALSRVVEQHDTIGVAFIGPLIVGITILGVVAGWQLKELRPSGVRLARIYFMVGLCFAVVGTGFVTVEGLLKAVAGPSAEAIGEAIGRGIGAFVVWCLGPIMWLAYLAGSKRVRNTYFQGHSTQTVARGPALLRRPSVIVSLVLLAGALTAAGIALWIRTREAATASALVHKAQTWKNVLEKSHKVPPLPQQLVNLLPPDARPALEANVQLMREIGALPERDVYAVLKGALPLRADERGDSTAIRTQIQVRNQELRLLSVYGERTEAGYAALEKELASGTIPKEATSFAKGLLDTRHAFQQFVSLRRSKATAELDLLNFLTTSAGTYYLQDGKLISRSDRWLDQYGKLVQAVDTSNAALLKFVAKARDDAQNDFRQLQ
jgi:zinc-ribbon domain